jgi:hypothetical protein
MFVGVINLCVVVAVAFWTLFWQIQGKTGIDECTFCLVSFLGHLGKAYIEVPLRSFTFNSLIFSHGSWSCSTIMKLTPFRAFVSICKYFTCTIRIYLSYFVEINLIQSIFYIFLYIYICKNTHTHIYIYILVLKYLYCVFPPLAWVKFHPFLVSCRIISLINLFASLVDTRFTRGLSHLELSYIATCWYLLTSCDP